MTRIMTGAEMVVEALKDHGVDTLFGYPGARSCRSTTCFTIRRSFAMSWSAMSRALATRPKAMPVPPDGPASCSSPRAPARLMRSPRSPMP